MNGFPQLTQQDLDEFEKNLNEFIAKSEANLALIVERAGYLIYASGEKDRFDSVTISTLASNAFNASAYLAGLLNDAKISGMLQQGEKFSVMILEIDEHCILVVVFNSSVSAGAIKYYALNIIPNLARQIMVAKQRSPEVQFDFADLNLSDVKVLFQRVDSPNQKPKSEIKQEVFPEKDPDDSSSKSAE